VTAGGTPWENRSPGGKISYVIGWIVVSTIIAGGVVVVVALLGPPCRSILDLVLGN